MGDAHQISGWLIHKWPSNLTFRPLEKKEKEKKEKEKKEKTSYKSFQILNLET